MKLVVVCVVLFLPTAALCRCARSHGTAAYYRYAPARVFRRRERAPTVGLRHFLGYT